MNKYASRATIVFQHRSSEHLEFEVVETQRREEGICSIREKVRQIHGLDANDAYVHKGMKASLRTIYLDVRNNGDDDHDTRPKLVI